MINQEELALNTKRTQLELDGKALTERESAFLVKVDMYDTEAGQVEGLRSISVKMKKQVDEVTAELGVKKKELSDLENKVKNEEKKLNALNERVR